MSGWRSTKAGKHFKLGSKPGIKSNHNNHSHSGSQAISMHTETKLKYWNDKVSSARAVAAEAESKAVVTGIAASKAAAASKTAADKVKGFSNIAAGIEAQIASGKGGK